MKPDQIFCGARSMRFVQGAKTSGRVPREATISVTIALATALTGEHTNSMVFKDAADAENSANEIAGRAAAAAAEQYQSAVRLQNMTGQVTISCFISPLSSNLHVSKCKRSVAICSCNIAVWLCMLCTHSKPALHIAATSCTFSSMLLCQTCMNLYRHSCHRHTISE